MCRKLYYNRTTVTVYFITATSHATLWIFETTVY